MNYTDVTPIQLFGGWAFAAFFLVISMGLSFVTKGAVRDKRYWFKNWMTEWDKVNNLNDKALSLEAQLSAMTERYNTERLAKQTEMAYIDRLILRPRQANGRFMKGTK